MAQRLELALAALTQACGPKAKSRYLLADITVQPSERGYGRAAVEGPYRQEHHGSVPIRFRLNGAAPSRSKFLRSSPGSGATSVLLPSGTTGYQPRRSRVGLLVAVSRRTMTVHLQGCAARRRGASQLGANPRLEEPRYSSLRHRTCYDRTNPNAVAWGVTVDGVAICC